MLFFPYPLGAIGGKYDSRFYSGNDISFYDPRVGCSNENSSTSISTTGDSVGVKATLAQANVQTPGAKYYPKSQRQRIVESIQKFSSENPDFITLNEIREDNTDYGNYKSFKQEYPGAKTIEDTGLRILWDTTKWEKVTGGIIQIHEYESPDSGRKDRYALWATFKNIDNGAGISVISTHYTTRSTFNPNHGRAKSQSENIKTLASKLLPGGPVLIAGDFNYRLGEEYLNKPYSPDTILGQAGFQQAIKQSDGSSVDWILYSEQLKLAGKKVYSLESNKADGLTDHPFVVATFEGSSSGAVVSSSGCTCSTGIDTLSGGSNKEMVWDWLIKKGMSEIGAAGIMGNMSVESGFNPFRLQVADENYDTLTSNDGYDKAFGLAQWDGGRRVEVLKYLANLDQSYKAFIDKKYGEEAESYKFAEDEQPGITEKFIIAELDFLYKESTGGGNRPTTWKSMLTATSPTDAANKFEEVFEGSVRPAGGSQVGEAIKIYNEFKSGTSDPGVYRTSDSTGCGSDENTTVSEEGGLTESQAKKLVMNYGANVDNDSANTVGSAYWNLCNGGGSNCVTFSRFFINKFSESPAPSPMGNGKDVVQKLGESGVPTGNTPKPFAIFSWSNSTNGHTGVILGINGDTAIIGEASCSSVGIGAGDGTTYDKGAAIIRVGKLNDPSIWFGKVPTEFAYPKNVNVSKIQDYVN